MQRKQISQETFDQCVSENVGDFDMSQEEALIDAVHQFESQGVDLSNIIKTGMTQTSEGQESLLLRLKRLITELKEILEDIKMRIKCQTSLLSCIASVKRCQRLVW